MAQTVYRSKTQCDPYVKYLVMTLYCPFLRSAYSMNSFFVLVLQRLVKAKKKRKNDADKATKRQFDTDKTESPFTLLNMLVILASITTFHIISAVLLFVSTINNAWWVSGNVYVDLWFACNNTCFPVINSESKGYLQAVQTTMILATILCCVGFIVFILQLIRLKQGERFVITSLVQLVSAFFIMIGASVYTAQHENFQAKSFKDGNYGYSFVLAWIALPVTMVNGLMYAFLRKRK